MPASDKLVTKATLGRISSEFTVGDTIGFWVNLNVHTLVMEHAMPESEQRPDVADVSCASRFSTFDECPLCGGALGAEHAHFRCATCGWRDSCCD
jgi:hypothetical protein